MIRVIQKYEVTKWWIGQEGIYEDFAMLMISSTVESFKMKEHWSGRLFCSSFSMSSVLQPKAAAIMQIGTSYVAYSSCTFIRREMFSSVFSYATADPCIWETGGSHSWNKKKDLK